MQAIILAAGMGRRLGELTNNNTKCMLEVNGKKLITRALDALDRVGITNVILVVGYKYENVQKLIGHKYKNITIDYVVNNVYDKTNNIYSLYLAKDSSSVTKPEDALREFLSSEARTGRETASIDASVRTVPWSYTGRSLRRI